MKDKTNKNHKKKHIILSDIIDYMNHRLAIITVVYQNYEVLKDLFDSLHKQTNHNFHIFVSDLSDRKSNFAKASLDKQVTVISSANKGYAYGINLGLKEAIRQGFDKFCVINSDTYVQNDFVNSVLASITLNPSSVIGGKIYYASGFEYHKNKYKTDELGRVIWYAGGSIDWKNVYVNHHGVDQADHQQYNQLTKTDFITGCLICFDKSVIEKIGFWNEKYFLYFEDADFCERAKKKSTKLLYDPSIVIWHKNAQSTDGSGSKVHQKYQNKNRIKFGLRYAPLRTKLHIMKNAIWGLQEKESS